MAITAKDAAAYVRGKTAGEYGKKPRGKTAQYKRGYAIGRGEFNAWLKAQPKRAKPKARKPRSSKR